MRGKRGFEFSFALIFAFIVGAIILFLAIYAATKFVSTSRYQLDTETAKQLSIIFDPLETGVTSGKASRVVFPTETKVYDSCLVGVVGEEFGKQRFSLSSKQGIGGEWQEPGGEITVKNKYVFSQEIERGKEMQLFSLPFNFPFKVSEIIIMTSQNYCFINAPDFVKSDLEGLNLKNIEFEDFSNKSSCSGLTVCFNSACDISVYGMCESNCNSQYDYGIVQQEDQKSYYVGNLIYGAIFSDSSIYECNTERLAKRVSSVSQLYRDEAIFIAARGCTTNLEADFNALSILSGNITSSQQLLSLLQFTKDIDYKNENLRDCKIY